MGKDEFLQALRRALNNNVPPAVVEENIQYYDSYINEEVSKGRTEEEVTEEIGSPRLIARNIINTTEIEEEPENDHSSSDHSYNDDPNYDRDGDYGGSSRPRRHFFDMSKWYSRLLVMVLIFGVIYLITFLIGGVFTLLSPIIGPILMIWMIYTLIRMFNRRR